MKVDLLNRTAGKVIVFLALIVGFIAQVAQADDGYGK